MSGRVRWALGAGGLLALVVGSVGLGAWLLAEDAGVAPPPDVAARTAARRVERAWTAPTVPDEGAADSGDAAPATCPGRVEATLPDGAPFEGRVKMGGVWAPLDGGSVWMDARPCGRALLRVQAEGGAGVRGLSTSARVTVQGDAPVRVVVGAPGEAEVETIDAQGARVDARVSGAEVLAPGLFRVAGLGPTRRVVVGGHHDFGRRVEIPLDGGRHAVEVVPDRVVAVTLQCDHCPERVTCERDGGMGEATCSGAPPNLRCRCPPGPATLMARWPDALLDHTDHVQPLSGVHADAWTVAIDVEGQPGMVEGQLAPDTLVTLSRPGSGGRHVPLDEDGSFSLVDLLPGDWGLSWRALGRPESQAHGVAFHLPSGATLDLGRLAAPASEPP